LGYSIRFENIRILLGGGESNGMVAAGAGVGVAAVAAGAFAVAGPQGLAVVGAGALYVAKKLVQHGGNIWHHTEKILHVTDPKTYLWDQEPVPGWETMKNFVSEKRDVVDVAAVGAGIGVVAGQAIGTSADNGSSVPSSDGPIIDSPTVRTSASDFGELEQVDTKPATETSVLDVSPREPEQDYRAQVNPAHEDMEQVTLVDMPDLLEQNEQSADINPEFKVEDRTSIPPDSTQRNDDTRTAPTESQPTRIYVRVENQIVEAFSC